MGFSVAVQTVIYSALSVDAGLAALVSTRIYDNVPQDTAYPYVTIGDDTHTADNTDDELGSSVVCTIHTWSRERGMRETKLIQDAIYDALNRANLSLAGYVIVNVLSEGSDSFLDVDGLTRHGVSNFRLLIDEA